MSQNISITHEVDLTLLGIRDCEYHTYGDGGVCIEETLKDINSNKIIKQLVKDKFKKGDILHDSKYDYRNDGKYVFDGEKFIDLNNEIDDYGSAPDIFLNITDVPLNFWTESICHNSLVWCDFSDMQIMNILSLNKYLNICMVTHNEINYGIIYYKKNDIQKGKAPYSIVEEVFEAEYLINKYLRVYEIDFDNLIQTLSVDEYAYCDESDCEDTHERRFDSIYE